MKILFFIDSLDRGGKERRLAGLMKSLLSSPEIEFEVVVMNKEIHYKEVLNFGIKIHFLIRNQKKDISVFSKFYKICKNYRPDIIHCWDSMTAMISVPACTALNIKLVNGMVVDTPIKRNIFNKDWFRARLTFPFSSVVTGNSNAGLAAYNAPKKKSVCIYNGIDFSRFKNLKEPAIVRKEIFGDECTNTFIAGMVAAFEKRKDYKTLIKAAMTLISRHNDIRFILVGHGSEFSEIKNQVPSTLLNKILFLGMQYDVESIINIFDVGILLTNSKVHGEGISNSVIEYMALSKPVIATRGGGTNEIVIDNQNGFLIDACNEEQLVEKIDALKINKDLMIEMGRKGNQLIHEKFDHERMKNHYIKIYENSFN